MAVNPEPVTDLSEMKFWSTSPQERELGFARLRAENPVSWQRQPESTLGATTDNQGFWAVVRYADIAAVSKAPDRFCSGQGARLDNIPPEVLDQFESFLAMDDPRHGRLRRLVSRAFTPRQMQRIEASIQVDARRVIDELGDQRDGDFVDRVSKRLPMMTILRMLGVTDDDVCLRLADLTEGVVTYSDPVALGDRDPAEMMGDLMTAFHEIAGATVERVRKHPGDDLVSDLVRAEVDGEKLTHEEIVAFFTLLSIAGNDTTKQTTSGAMLALTRYPDQRRVLLSNLGELIKDGVEEFIRWVTPVASMCRTASRDTVLGGKQIQEGQKLAMFYASANMDGDVFEDPQVFNVRRNPNPHFGFGGGGPHYCLGSSLARVSLTALFVELLSRYPDLQVGEPHWVLSNNLNGILRLPMETGKAAVLTR